MLESQKSVLYLSCILPGLFVRRPGRVEDWRACCRWRVSRPALSRAGWVHHSTVATFPTPATSHRTGGSPAYGFPTPYVQERSRSWAASSSRGEAFESTGAVQGLKVFGRSAPLQAGPPPWPHTLSPLAIQVLDLRGRVAHADIGAPPAHDQVACCHHRRDGTPHAAAFGLLPQVAPYGLPGFLSRPHAWDALPGRPGSACMDVAPEPLTPGALHGDDPRRGGRPRQVALLPARRDRRQGWRGLASRVADKHHVVRIPREGTPPAIRRCPVPRQHLYVDVGPQRAQDAPLG